MIFKGNLLVCIAIGTDRRLHNVTNYFLFSLALADLFVCIFVMPLSLMVEFKQGEWRWNFWLCLLYTYSDVFLCSASIVHMSVISLDRYLGISEPLKTRNKSRTIVILKIIFVWLMTTIISSPLAVLALMDPTNILQNNACVINNRYYMLYGSTLSFLIPFIIMAVTYVKTTKLLNKQADLLTQRTDRFHNGLRRTVMPHRKLGYIRTNSYSKQTSSSQQQNFLVPQKHKSTANGVVAPVSSNKNTSTRTESLPVNRGLVVPSSINGTLSNQLPVFIQTMVDIEEQKQLPYADINTGISSTQTNMMEQQSPISNGKSHSNSNALLSSNKTSLLTTTSSIISTALNEKQSCANSPSMVIRSQMGRIRSQTGSVLRNLAERRKSGWLRTPNGVNALANEHKATRVLAVVFICFFICWTPFFFINFTQGFCGMELCSVPNWTSALFQWLGYLSSTLNPIIYTIFNRRFRQAFLRIIRCEWIVELSYGSGNGIQCCGCRILVGTGGSGFGKDSSGIGKRSGRDFYSNYSRTHTLAGADTWMDPKSSVFRESQNRWPPNIIQTIYRKVSAGAREYKARTLSIPCDIQQESLQQRSALSELRRRQSLNPEFPLLARFRQMPNRLMPTIIHTVAEADSMLEINSCKNSFRVQESIAGSYRQSIITSANSFRSQNSELNRLNRNCLDKAASSLMPTSIIIDSSRRNSRISEKSIAINYKNINEYQRPASTQPDRGSPTNHQYLRAPRLTRSVSAAILEAVSNTGHFDPGQSFNRNHFTPTFIDLTPIYNQRKGRRRFSGFRLLDEDATSVTNDTYEGYEDLPHTTTQWRRTENRRALLSSVEIALAIVRNFSRFSSRRQGKSDSRLSSTNTPIPETFLNLKCMENDHRKSFKNDKIEIEEMATTESLVTKLSTTKTKKTKNDWPAAQLLPEANDIKRYDKICKMGDKFLSKETTI